MAIFNSYVKLPEGNSETLQILGLSHCKGINHLPIGAVFFHPQYHGGIMMSWDVMMILEPGKSNHL